jgi:hypothetical protein
MRQQQRYDKPCVLTERNFVSKSLSQTIRKVPSMGRAAITLPASQRPLHDYVPLYLGFKTPMVAIKQAHNEDLLFLRFSLGVLVTPGSVVCDGNADPMLQNSICLQA